MRFLGLVFSLYGSLLSDCDLLGELPTVVSSPLWFSAAFFPCVCLSFLPVPLLDISIAPSCHRSRVAVRAIFRPCLFSPLLQHVSSFRPNFHFLQEVPFPSPLAHALHIFGHPFPDNPTTIFYSLNYIDPSELLSTDVVDSQNRTLSFHWDGCFYNFIKLSSCKMFIHDSSDPVASWLSHLSLTLLALAFVFLWIPMIPSLLNLLRKRESYVLLLLTFLRRCLLPTVLMFLPPFFLLLLVFLLLLLILCLKWSSNNVFLLFTLN